MEADFGMFCTFGWRGAPQKNCPQQPENVRWTCLIRQLLRCRCDRRRPCRSSFCHSVGNLSCSGVVVKLGAKSYVWLVDWEIQISDIVSAAKLCTAVSLVSLVSVFVISENLCERCGFPLFFTELGRNGFKSISVKIDQLTFSPDIELIILRIVILVHSRNWARKYCCTQKDMWFVDFCRICVLHAAFLHITCLHITDITKCSCLIFAGFKLCR